MKNTTRVCFSIIVLILAIPGFAQQKAKKEVRWQDSLYHVWGMDSTLRFDDGEWENREDEEDTGTRIRFYSNGTMVIWDLSERHGQPYVARYELLSGEKNRYVSMASENLLQIETMTAKNLVLRLKSSHSERRIHFSRRPDEQKDLKPWIAGNYLLKNSNSYRDYEEGGFGPAGAILTLDTSGKMKHAFGEGDSGTWKITDNLVLELNGAKKQLRFDLVKMEEEKIGLHPVGSSPDSTLLFKQIWMEEDMTERPSDPGMYDEVPPQGWEDSLRAADSMAMMEAMMEAEMAMEEAQTEMGIVGGTWKTIPEGQVQLNLSDDGKVVYQQGKKKYEGTWKRTDYSYTYGEQYVIMTMEGKEQLVRYIIVQSGYGETPTMEMTLMFMPPKSKKLETLIMQRGE